jgi:hypothetical protein
MMVDEITNWWKDGTLIFIAITGIVAIFCLVGFLRAIYRWFLFCWLPITPIEKMHPWRTFKVSGTARRLGIDASASVPPFQLLRVERNAGNAEDTWCCIKEMARGGRFILEDPSGIASVELGQKRAEQHAMHNDNQATVGLVGMESGYGLTVTGQQATVSLKNCRIYTQLRHCFSPPEEFRGAMEEQNTRCRDLRIDPGEHVTVIRRPKGIAARIRPLPRTEHKGRLIPSLTPESAHLCVMNGDPSRSLRYLWRDVWVWAMNLAVFSGLTWVIALKSPGYFD